MKLSKGNPIVRLTRWLTFQRGFNKALPSMLRYGGWPFMLISRLFGINALLLTTTGRKTGKPRTSQVMYINQGQDLIIAAHYAGSNRHPNWYLNLVANPAVTVELFWKRRPYLAEPVQDQAEKEALLEQFPFGLVETFQDYTTRDIPVIRLRPAAEGG